MICDLRTPTSLAQVKGVHLSPTCVMHSLVTLRRVSSYTHACQEWRWELQVNRSLAGPKLSTCLMGTNKDERTFPVSTVGAPFPAGHAPPRSHYKHTQLWIAIIYSHYAPAARKLSYSKSVNQSRHERPDSGDFVRRCDEVWKFKRFPEHRNCLVLTIAYKMRFYPTRTRDLHRY